MLFRYTTILAGSAGMTLAACVCVFKWDSVKRDAGHGTMFMVFFCWFTWSSASLVRTLFVYSNNGLDTTEHPRIRNMTFITETLFNATSMWLIAAMYECKRRAMAPRITARSHRRCLVAYMSVISGLSLIFYISMVIVDRSGATVAGFDPNDPNEEEPLAAIALSKFAWATWGLRCLAVVFLALVTIWLESQRDRLQFVALPKALSWIVLVLVVLNMPYLVIDALIGLDVLHPSNDMRFMGIMKTFTYMSGIAMSAAMGLAVRGFDAFFNSKAHRINSRRHDMFVVSDRSDS
ncbi:hypothetical protein DYB32_007511 [Aphanomyces invadans]|uniref:Uncharacterized protein n=1 Tax=Aphanomyces invadans TaxID=157072 RepID=A0A418ANS4_9STRA|nr:hypothetical protein DYB32_007511 [Aphanomyces invadans]